MWTWLLCDNYLVPLLDGLLSTWCCASHEGLGTPIMHAVCYLCKTWCLGANGVTCMMIPLVLTTPAFSSGLTMLKSKLFSAVRICLSKYEYLVLRIQHSVLVILSYCRLFPPRYTLRCWQHLLFVCLSMSLEDMLVLAVPEVVVFVGAPCRQLTWLCVRKYMWQFIVSLDFQCECNCNCNSVGLGRLLKNLKKNGGKHVLPMQHFVACHWMVSDLGYPWLGVASWNWLI